MKNILLIAPGAEASQKTQASWLLHSNQFVQKRAFTSPLHIATVAGLTPPGFEVDLWDEPVQGLINADTKFEKDYDLVGITGYGLHYRRARNIASVFRDRGIPVAVGGPGVSSLPAIYRAYFDILFLGEAELTWPQFLADFEKGDYRKEYESSELPDMAVSASPRWESIAGQMKTSYLTGSVQITRGCPYDCEFCDVWQIFGRKMRVKPLERVFQEISALERLGVDTILLCSDNFVGNPRYAKNLVRGLIPLNNSFKEPLQYRTELTITVARDEELLELMADAHFTGVLIGIESPNEKSLIETRKRQNIRYGDLVENCKKVMSYGIPIDGSMIVGFDNDTPEIFDEQFEFIQEACISFPRPHMMKAIPGTDLWKRLTSEGRVVDVDSLYGNIYDVDPQHTTNILPKQMTRIELMAGYLSLVERLVDWDNFVARIKGFVANVKRQPKVSMKNLTFPERLKSALPRMDPKAREAIESVFAFTEQQAPFMTLAVSILAMRQFQEVVRLPNLRECIMRQIDTEQSLDLTGRMVAPRHDVVSLSA